MAARLDLALLVASFGSEFVSNSCPLAGSFMRIAGCSFVPVTIGLGLQEFGVRSGSTLKAK